MIKELTSFSLGMLLGVAVSSYDNETKKIVNYIIERGSNYFEDIKTLVVQSLKNIEEIDSDQIKINYEKVILILKEKIKEIAQFKTIDEQFNYATQEISNFFIDKKPLTLVTKIYKKEDENLENKDDTK